MPDNQNNSKKPSSIPEKLQSIADDEALKEIDFGDFLEENSKTPELFKGFHDDIEKTEKNLADELQSLYDDIMESGPKTIVPKPISVLSADEAEPKKVALSDPQVPENSENGSLDDLWMNPEDYFDDDIPVVSLDDEGESEPALNENSGEIPDEAFFAPESATKPVEDTDAEKDSIFSMINSLKEESNSETGFSDILSEIESNKGIAPVADELSSAAELVESSRGAADALADAENDDDEISFGDDFNWDDFELENEVPEPEAPEIPEVSVNNDIPETPEAAEVAEPQPEENAFVPQTDEEFERELAALLGDEPPVSALEPESITEQKPGGFFINISGDDNDYEAAAAAQNEQEAAPAPMPERLYESEPMSSGVIDENSIELDEDDKGSRKKSKKGKKSEKGGDDSGEKKPVGAGEIVRRIVLSLSIITIIASCGILINTYFIEPYRFKSSSENIVSQMNANISEHNNAAVVDNSIQNENPDVDFPEGMLAKYAQLYAANSDLAGWISIPGLDINLPIAQGKDNSYYLKKDIYKKYTSYGVPFFDYRITDLRNLHRNTVVYGHNMRHDDYIFGMLENYREIDGFAQAPVIECNTIYGDHTWFVYAVFITNSDPSDDNGYLFPYNFIDTSDAKFAEYIKEIDSRKLYTTGVDINEKDKILTLSTCCYDFDDARLVVVAREKREGESVSVDPSKAYYNQNPRYPQAWYDANKKSNPYAESARW